MSAAHQTEGIILDAHQQRATRKFIDWITLPAPLREDPIFRLHGYAGTGKSTLLSMMVAMVEKTLVMAYTGKASMVLKAKGIDAATIHRSIYKCVMPDPERIRDLLAALADAQACGTDTQRLEAQLAAIDRPRFGWNAAGPAANADLIVIDESSMLSEDILVDILRYRKPVLLVGDPMQLPPVEGRSALARVGMPDVVLTEIHRQARGNPIILLSELVRSGRPIPLGRFGDTVSVVRRLDPGVLVRADQVLCGFNKTRIRLNAAIRKAIGFDDPFPMGTDEKIICLKNSADTGFVNGGFLSLDNVRTTICDDAEVLKADVAWAAGQGMPETVLTNRDINPAGLAESDAIAFGGLRSLRNALEIAFGYAITVHKAQGSQWPNVVVYEEPVGRGDVALRWLYTAVTRGAERLIIVRTSA